MKTTNKEYAKSDRPVSGFYNVLLQRIYNKVDGIDVSKIDKVIEVLTISQLKDLSVDVSKYGIKNDQGLAGRFENTRNYIFPVDAMQNLLSKEDHATFKANYDRACKELEKQIAEEKKAKDPVRAAVMQVVSDATVKTEEKQPDPVKTAIADVIPLNATVKTEKAEKVQDPVKVETEKKAEKKTESKVLPLDQKIIVSGSPKTKKIVEKAINDHLGKSEEKKPEEKKEEKKQENKAEELTVSKSVTIDSNYIENLIAAAPVAKKSKAKKSIKKSDLEQIAALF